MEFGERLAALREQKGLTQAQIAEQVGISRRMYVAYENEGKRPRKLDTYHKLAESLGCDVNDLLVEDFDAGQAAYSIDFRKGRYKKDSPKPAAAAAIMSSLLWPIGIASLPVSMALSKVFEGSHNEPTSFPASAMPMTQRAEVEQKRMRDHKRFTATAKGLIYEELVKQGIPFTTLSETGDNTESIPESVITLDRGRIRTWWLYFVEDLLKADGERMDPDACASILLASVYESRPDESRKTSFVVEDVDLFAALVRRRERNSYRGNLSVILIDADSISLAEEVFIATYGDGDDTRDLIRVALDTQQNEPVVA